MIVKRLARKVQIRENCNSGKGIGGRVILAVLKVLIAGMVLCIPGRSTDRDQRDGKNVLVIYSYFSYFARGMNVVEGGVKPPKGPNQFLDLIESSVRARMPDSPALQFTLQYHDKMFPGNRDY